MNTINKNGTLHVDINLRKARGKTLLKDIHFEVKPGEMVLIMGGSGAGKSTLLKSITGDVKAQDALITYCGLDMYDEKSFSQLQKKIGFVPQSDENLISGDTVENILFDAGRMAGIKDSNKLKKTVNELLDKFALSSERNKLVSSLSGGEKKRLATAKAFIKRPTLFFLDEPDSSLDVFAKEKLIKLLREINQKEHTTVIVISHNSLEYGPTYKSIPNYVEQFDKVIVLVKDNNNVGRLGFFGSIEDACYFFEVGSLKEIVKRIEPINKEGEGKGNYFIEKYNKIVRATGNKKQITAANTANQKAKKPDFVTLYEQGARLFSSGYYLECLEICKTIYPKYIEFKGENNPETLDLVFLYANANYKLKEYKEALKLLKILLSKEWKNHWTTDSANLYTVIFLVGASEFNLRNYEAALKSLEIVYPTYKEGKGKNKEAFLLLEMLSKSYYNLKKYEEAAPLLHELYSKYKLYKGDDNHETLTIKKMLADTLFSIDKYEDALVLYKELYFKYKELKGEDNDATLLIKERLANTLYELSEYEDALVLFKELESKKCTRSINRGLSYTLYKLGRYAEALIYMKKS